MSSFTVFCSEDEVLHVFDADEVSGTPNTLWRVGVIWITRYPIPKKLRVAAAVFQRGLIISFTP